MTKIDESTIFFQFVFQVEQTRFLLRLKIKRYEKKKCDDFFEDAKNFRSH